MKRYSVLFVREMKKTYTVRYHFILTKMAIVKKEIITGVA